MTDPTYLGDGVYATFDGYQVKLYVFNGIHENAAIYLDDTVAMNLLDYIKKCWEIKGG